MTALLSGIIVPLITPLTPQPGLDSPALVRLIDHVISGGVSGIFLLGSTGEGPGFSLERRKEIVKEGIKATAKRVPVLVNISSASYGESMDMAGFAADAGADYVVLSPPFYFGMNQHELSNYFRSIADYSPLPMVLYNAPKYTGTAIESGLAGELESHQNIAGIKDSSGDLSYIKELIKGRKDSSFSILIGPEILLGESLFLGCNGGVCGGANLYPEFYVNYYRAAVARERNEMENFERVLRKIQKDLYEVAGSPMGIVIGLKHLLSRKGICTEQMATPIYESFSPVQTKTLEMLDKEMKLI